MHFQLSLLAKKMTLKKKMAIIIVLPSPPRISGYTFENLF